MIVRWSRIAATQLFDAGDYIREQRPGWDERLYLAAQKVTHIIQQQPRAFARMAEINDGEVRGAHVALFDYWVIYEIDEVRDECVILAFWSMRRHPQGWRFSR